jgi:asparagine synthase (glutamine-hydrolysing)
MCGLCGVVRFGAPAEVETVERMTAALAHRGPDGTGMLARDGIAIGHNRLAIIDTSDAGIQPLTAANGRVLAFHNGEIYNYRELRRELEARGHPFTTQTDTEVVAVAYAEWGPSCVERFNGMWAVAIWDEERRSLFCSRDRFGVKPFYYRHADGRFVFASELKAFAAEGTALKPNITTVRDFLDQGFLDHTQSTFFDGIEALAPGTSIVIDQNGLHRSRYWRLEATPPPPDAEEKIRELFLDSVRLRLRSDVPVGSCLSGGIDSSAVVGAAAQLLRTEPGESAQLGSHVQTFTAAFPDAAIDERPYARAVVDFVGGEPHWVELTAADVVETLPAVVYAQDEPFGSTSIVAQWHVMRAARVAGVKVMLDGQGGDEVFAGYHSYFGPWFVDLLRQGRGATLFRELRSFSALPGGGGRAVVREATRALLTDRARWRLRSRIHGAADIMSRELRTAAPTPPPKLGGRDRLHHALELLLLSRSLPGLLHYEDRNSMAHSLEARVPFLDYRLVEAAYSLEGSELIRNGTTKDVLRRAVAELLPARVRERRDKIGFATPESRWLREDLGSMAADIFASRSFAERGWFEPSGVRRKLEEHRTMKVDAGFELFRALSVELWARRFIDR